jgi:hypothetical protein
MPIADAFDLAFGIQCCDNQWNLNCDPDGAVAAMLTMGDGIFELMGNAQHEAYFARMGAYNRIREALEAIWPDLHCGVSDPWSYDAYSDLYKDEYGCRPRGQVTGAEVRSWLARRDAA